MLREELAKYDEELKRRKGLAEAKVGDNDEPIDTLRVRVTEIEMEMGNNL